MWKENLAAGAPLWDAGGQKSGIRGLCRKLESGCPVVLLLKISCRVRSLEGEVRKRGRGRGRGFNVEFEPLGSSPPIGVCHGTPAIRIQ